MSAQNTQFDFTMAKNKHLQWKIKLRSFLDGKATMTLDEAVSHHDCDLGKWLYSVGMNEYKSFSEMNKLESVHSDLHKVIKNVVNFKQSGNTAGAESELAKVNTLSNEIVGLLDSLSKH